MTTVTVELPRDLAQRLQSYSGRLPDILEIGLRQWQAAGQPGFQGASDVLELLATLPSRKKSWRCVLLMRFSRGCKPFWTRIGKKACHQPKNRNGSSMSIWSISCVWPKPEPC